MPTRAVGVADTANADAVAEVEVIERMSPDIRTTLTADPGAAGTSLAVTERGGRFPQSGNFKVRAEDEVMRVTAGHGTGAGSWTSVARGIDGTTAVAHAIGTTVAYVVGTQRVSPIDERQITYIGQAATFKTLGRAGTAGQKIFAIHNATGSKTLVDIDRITCDVMQTAAKVVEPALVRLWRFTAIPTNGSNLTKVPVDSGMTSNASVTLWQDSSADNTGSATTLTITLPANNIITESWAARALTLVGYEQFDREIFLGGEGEVITLRPLEGIAVYLDYGVATANPVTDKWTVTCRWFEYTAP